MGTKVHGGNGTIGIWCDDFVLCALLNTFDIDHKRTVAEARTFCGLEQKPGQHEAAVKFGSYADFGTAAWDETAFSKFDATGDRNWLGLYGSAIGSIGREVLGKFSDQNRKSSIADFVMIDGGLTGNTITRVASLGTGVTVTGTGTKASTNAIGATTSGQTFVFTVRVTAVTGSGSISFLCEESSDDGSVDTFGTVTGSTLTFTAVGVQRFTTTSATEAYKRLRISAYSGFTNVTYTVTCGLQAANN